MCEAVSRLGGNAVGPIATGAALHIEAIGSSSRCYG